MRATSLTIATWRAWVRRWSAGLPSARSRIGVSTPASPKTACTSPLGRGAGGVGRLLLAELVRVSEEAGFWTIQTGIFPENLASVRLHQACGFRVVGRRERIGQMDGRWRDTLFLERRSELV